MKGTRRERDLYFARLDKLENEFDAEATSIISSRKIDESHRDGISLSFPIDSQRDLEVGVVRFFFLAVRYH